MTSAVEILRRDRDVAFELTEQRLGASEELSPEQQQLVRVCIGARRRAPALAQIRHCSVGEAFMVLTDKGAERAGLSMPHESLVQTVEVVEAMLAQAVVEVVDQSIEQRHPQIDIAV